MGEQGSEKRYEEKIGEERVWQVFVCVREIEVKRIGGRVRERERDIGDGDFYNQSIWIPNYFIIIENTNMIKGNAT